MTKRNILLLLLLPIVLAGCALRGKGHATAYDYSDYEAYDQHLGASSSYGDAGDLQ
ncbi:MAG TPA: hypothetical protein VL400_10155 [Polyangiaceae bacterium]|nr:hypothetical protein [Polyangiaceae bacterium]